MDAESGEGTVEQRSPIAGMPKSGRPWKCIQKKPSRAKVVSKPLHTSWQAKMTAREQKLKVKQMEDRIRQQRRQEIAEKKQQLQEREKRRLANERRAEVTQVIKNTAKLRTMSKKQLRMIRKADTTVVQPSSA